MTVVFTSFTSMQQQVTISISIFKYRETTAVISATTTKKQCLLLLWVHSQCRCWKTAVFHSLLSWPRDNNIVEFFLHVIIYPTMVLTTDYVRAVLISLISIWRHLQLRTGYATTVFPSFLTMWRLNFCLHCATRVFNFWQNIYLTTVFSFIMAM